MTDSEDLLRQLETRRDDVELLAVLGDSLQRAGDPRGELIAIQLAIGHAPRETAVALGARQQALVTQLSPVFDGALAYFAPRDDVIVLGDQQPPPLRTALLWGIGFVRTLRLSLRNAYDRPSAADAPAFASALASLWSHPSMRLLDELECGDQSSVDLLELAPPPTVRSLSIDAPICSAYRIGTLVAGLPRLERLRIHDATELADLASTSVTSISMTLRLQGWRTTIPALGLARLPALSRLVVMCERLPRRAFEELCERIARSSLLPRLRELVLRTTEVTERAAHSLVEGLDGHLLDRLDFSALRWVDLTSSVRAILEPACRQLLPAARDASGSTAEAAPSNPDTEWVVHVTKPEWGKGKVVRRFDGKIEVAFPHAGTKVFKADAPFLRYG